MSDATSRFSAITDHDHQAWLWSISLMSLTFALLTLGMRLVVKWRMYGTDDLALGVAYVLALGHWSTMFAALEKGVGKDTTLVKPSALVEASKLIYSSRILLLLALAFSKCTVLLFLRNLFTCEMRSTWRTCNILSVVAVSWGVVAALAVSVGCPTPQDFVGSSSVTCPAESARWRAIVAIDVILECLIAALATVLFARLHMRIDRKITVISAFYFRLPTAAIFLVFLDAQLHYLSPARTVTVSASLAVVNPLICLEALVCYALLSATIPCLRGFLGRFRTGDLLPVDDSTGRYGYGGSGQIVQGLSFHMRSLKSMKHSGKQDSHPQLDERALFAGGDAYGHNAGHVEHMATATAASPASQINRPETSEEGASIQSVGSEELIIHRKTVVEVRRE